MTTNPNVAPGVVRAATTASAQRHVCPVWIGYLLASPIRKLFENPERVLGAVVKPGDLALDIGCAMGFFTVPLARQVGPNGRVVCVDVQPEMLEALKRRLAKRGLAARVEARLTQETDLPLGDLAGAADVALIIHVVHEVPDQQVLFRGIAAALKPGGKVIFAEPKGHVSDAQFAQSLRIAAEAGLDDAGPLPMKRSHNRLLKRR